MKTLKANIHTQQLKYYLFSACIVTCLWSCQNNQKSVTKGTVAKPSRIAVQRASLIAEYKPILQGVWIKKDYIDKMALTRSPAAAAELQKGITSMYFDTSEIAKDSLLADAVWNNHEGDKVILNFKPGKYPHTLLLFEDRTHYVMSSLGYQIRGRDTMLIKYHTENGQTTAINYFKVLNAQPHNQLDAGMKYIINKTLVAGNYILLGKKVKKTVISFTNTGQVTGFNDFHTYYIKNDVGGEFLNNLDEITFNEASKKPKRKDFAYKIKGDTLTLYNSYPNDNFTESVIGELVYQLVRQP